MSKVLIIGCGGVASVAIHKCCQVPEVFTEICIASRTKSKCDKLAAELAPKTATKITTAQVDADKVDEVIALIKAYQPDLVMNIALPYQDLTIMDACLACGVNYMDTANYEPENTDDPAWREIYEKRCKELGFSAYFDYSWQWAYAKKFEEAGLTALLGSGFDPGVTQAYCAYAKKHEFDTIDTIDILDCNGGDHGYPFATNFNPEINLREVSAPGSYWENGHWVEIPAMSIKREYNFDQVGQKDMYLLHHEEIESLAKNIPEAKRIRFFMTFGQSYLDHMRCLEDVGMLSTTPVNFNGQEIVPIQFLKALLPDPASLGPRTKGKTNIGCIFTGKKDGKEKTYYIYNVCDHQECYKEVGSQAISYTTGVPAMCGALMLLTGKWTTKGVHTVEEFDPDPYLDALGQVRPAPFREPQPGAGGLMRLADTRPPFAGLANLFLGKRLPLCPPPATCWTKGSCAATANFCWGCSSAQAAKFCWRRRLFPTLMFTRCWLLIWRAPRPAACTRAALAKKSCRKKKNHVFCAAYRTDEFAELLQYADHIVFNSPSQLAKFGPAAKAAGKSVGLRLNPELLHAGRPCNLRPLRPGQPPWHHPRPVGCRRAGRPGPARITGRTALPHPVRAGCRCTGPDAGGGGSKVRGSSAPDEVAQLWRRAPYHPPRLPPCHAGTVHYRNTEKVRRAGVSGAGRSMGAERRVSCYHCAGYFAKWRDEPCHSGHVCGLPHPGCDRDALPPAAAGCRGTPAKSRTSSALAAPCLPCGDVVGDYSFSSPLTEGQRLIFGDMAIYTTCKNNTFNGMPLPPIWAMDENGTCRELVRFGYNDFKMRLGRAAD